MTFGYKIRSLRGARVETQRSLAARLKMDTAYLSRIESDVIVPKEPTIKRIIKALNAKGPDADELFALAGRVPPDVLSKLVKNPRLFQEIRDYKN